MVEQIVGLPTDVLGFRVTGKLSRDEYHDSLMKPIYAALERGEKLRILIELPDDFHGLDAGALWEDLKGRWLGRTKTSFSLGAVCACDGQGLGASRRQCVRLDQPRRNARLRASRVRGRQSLGRRAIMR